MKRRTFLQNLAVAPAVAVPALQQPPTGAGTPVAPPGVPTPAQPQIPQAGGVPKLDTTPADVAASPAPSFFSPPQFAALRRLSDIIVPSLAGAPGALDAEAPAFLDFLIGASPDDRKALYRNGLDTLQTQARTRFSLPFEDLSVEQAESLLAPLREPWTFTPPADPFAAFLRAAKMDIRTATQNSTASSAAATAAGGRGSGVGLYWYVVE